MSSLLDGLEADDREKVSSGLGALLVGYYDAGRLRSAGKVGTGFDDRRLRQLRNQLNGLERESAPFSGSIREPRVHWVEAELVAQIGFTEWTGDGKLRHPRFQGLRNDNAAQEVVREG